MVCLLLLVLVLCPYALAEQGSDTAGLTRGEMQALLQRFVDKLYLKGFRHLGDERDFDHGHFLFSKDSSRPLAVLYHTQELARYQDPAGNFGYLDPGGRNWIQWMDRDLIENANRYVRTEYPRSPFWDWFRIRELPALEEQRTIVPTMLDPAMGLDFGRSIQWVFTRTSCGSPTKKGPNSDVLRVVLPTKETICLAVR